MHCARFSATTLLALGLLGIMAPGISDAGKFKQAYKGIHGRYIVILKGMVPGASAGGDRVTVKAAEIRSRFAGAKVNRQWHNAVQGLDTNLTPAQAFKLARDTDVALVEQDARIQLQTIQSPVTWGLDRIDQPSLPLSSSYVYGTGAPNVTAYVIDTGILATHADFGGRVSSGYSSILNAQGQADYTDCNGHGTHVAGTIGSKTFGVAKEVKLVNVRVLDCNGSGTVSGVIAGINWVTQNRILPAAANLSLGGSLSAAMDLAVRNSIAAGVTYAVAAGNSNTSACSSSPADVTEALTVGATDISDNRSSFSNYGSCVDLFAPGTSILSTWNTSSVATATLSGTSMATPHVTGAAAIFLSGSPAATPSQVAAALVAQASSGKLFNVGAGSPNLLLFTNSTAPVTPPSITPPTVGLTAPTSGQTLSGTVTLSANASDAISVSKVEFLVDGALVATDSTSPYAASWNSASVTDGAHTFEARATGSTGLSSVSTLINATTSNSPAPVPSCLAQSDLILNPGFEAGASVWLANPANLITNSTRFSPASGNWYALLGGTGRRANFSLSQGVTLPVNACSASLGFDLMIITTETTKRSRYDTLTVRILDPITNRVLGTSRSYSNLDASSGYGKVKLDLTAYRGKTIRIEFLGQEDQGNSTSFLIDNVSLAIAQ